MPFDTDLGVCSDRGASQECPSGAVLEGSVCDSAATSSVAAQCGTCDYNPLTSSCFLHRVTRAAMPYTCASGTLPTRTFNASTLTGTVSGLAPYVSAYLIVCIYVARTITIFPCTRRAVRARRTLLLVDLHQPVKHSHGPRYTQYRFAVAATNSNGGTSPSVPSRRVWTLEDAPEGVLAPVVLALDASQVTITWSPPSQPNGIVREYRLVRFVGPTRTELVRTDAVSHLVVALTAGPYSPISVAVEACTSAGCTMSTVVVGHSSPGP